MPAVGWFPADKVVYFQDIPRQGWEAVRRATTLAIKENAMVLHRMPSLITWRQWWMQSDRDVSHVSAVMYDTDTGCILKAVVNTCENINAFKI